VLLAHLVEDRFGPRRSPSCALICATCRRLDRAARQSLQAARGPGMGSQRCRGQTTPPETSKRRPTPAGRRIALRPRTHETLKRSNDASTTVAFPPKSDSSARSRRTPCWADCAGALVFAWPEYAGTRSLKPQPAPRPATSRGELITSHTGNAGNAWATAKYLQREETTRPRPPVKG
jgi:hypothetical protein